MINNKLLSSEEGVKPGFFYGYIILLASFLILFVAGGAQYSFGVFLKPVLNDFGWSRAAISGAYSLNMLFMGFFSIFTGRLCDRFGPRLVITICGLLVGLGYLLMSQVSTIWQIYLFFGVLVSIGMSGMTVPLMSTVTRWFVRRRSLANGIVASGVGFGITITPPLANLLIARYNWQISYAVMGIVCLVLISIIAQLLKRAPRQEVSLSRDANAVKNDSQNLQAQGLSVREALRTRQFWIICVVTFLFVFGQQTVTVHIVAHATDIGISAAAAATILSVFGIVCIPSKVSMGSLGDKIGNRNIMILVFSLASLSYIWLLFANELWMLYLFAVVLGFNYGGFSAVQPPLVADCFGLKAHGAIFGLVMFALGIGGALGPLIAGRIFDVNGSYNWAFILGTLLASIGMILLLFLRVNRK